MSLTDACNLNCKYCKPQGTKLEVSPSLSFDEFIRAINVFSRMGIDKVRFTGGEPLLYGRLVDLIREVRKNSSLRTIALTTNGNFLEEQAKALSSAGVDRVNISLDTLNEEKYRTITGEKNLAKTLRGLDACLALGFEQVKINCVLMGGFNTDEVEAFCNLTKDAPLDIRFIELMPMTDNPFFNKESFVPSSIIFDLVPNLVRLEKENLSDVADYYRLPQGKGRVGLISPTFSPFCSNCNRLRLTCDGYVKPCLHTEEEFSIRGKSEEEMEEVIREAIAKKPREHKDLTQLTGQKLKRGMSQIGG